MDYSWTDYLVSYCDDEIRTILLSENSSSDHFPLMVDATLLLDYDLQLWSSLINNPIVAFKCLGEATINAQKILIESSDNRDAMKLKPNIHVRLNCLPLVPELVRNRVPTCGDVGKFLMVNGTVIRAGVTRVLRKEQLWKCSLCKGTVAVKGRFELRYKLVAPTKCQTDGCRSYRFKHINDDPASCTDYQEIRIQEKAERLDMGSIPRSMTVVLQHDLVDSCKAGDDVSVYGTVSLMWEPCVESVRCALETVLHANYVHIHNLHQTSVDLTETVLSQHHSHWRRYSSLPLTGRNLILASFCPDLHQLYIVKLAALLVILGGVPHKDGRGTKVRGECHLLMVGDPGTGKSQILKYASKLSPRSVITTGIGSTSAGLTVAAVKEKDNWVLEAGAMVLADGGVCCIDELCTIRETDRVAIHEAMEQQTISVAKAGLVCKLNTRTTVLAATNPKGSYDPTQPLSVNVAIGTPLLSRFDLILVLQDDHTSRWDSLVAGCLLKDNTMLHGEGIMKQYQADQLWSFDEMQMYVSHVRALKPRLSVEAREVLGRYYRVQREQLTRCVSRTTIRMLESLVRLAQAHAKLMMRDNVALQDAIVAISIVESSMLESSLLGDVNILHSVFPDNPEMEYIKQRQLILNILKLPPDYGGEERHIPSSTQRPVPRVFRHEITEVPSLNFASQKTQKSPPKHRGCKKFKVAKTEPISQRSDTNVTHATTKQSESSSTSSLQIKNSFVELIKKRMIKEVSKSDTDSEISYDMKFSEDELNELVESELYSQNICENTAESRPQHTTESRPQHTTESRLMNNAESKSQDICTLKPESKLSDQKKSKETPQNVLLKRIPDFDDCLSDDIDSDGQEIDVLKQFLDSGSSQTKSDPTPITKDNTIINTPVTKMFNIFKNMPSTMTQKENIPHTNFVNTQLPQALTSSVLSAAVDAPHFSLSPIAVDNITKGRSVKKAPDVTEKEMRKKCNSDKLLKFHFQTRDKRKQ